MKRSIIEIDEALCNGCGDCADTCSEGAIRIVEGKAKVVREEFCDGFGLCVGNCPTGALTVVSREAPPFNERATIRNLRATGGEEAVERFEASRELHDGVGLGTIFGMMESAPHAPAKPATARSTRGCPGSAPRELKRRPVLSPGSPCAAAGCPVAGPATHRPAGDPAVLSELRQWPVQLHLVQPGASFFKDRELAIVSTCGPVASAEVHQRYLRDRGVVVGCPKLDDTSSYAQKLGAILMEPSIPKAIVVIMEVPCCGGLTQIALRARQISGRTDLVLEEHVLAVTGELKRTRRLD